ncbi:tetratricopeptide repeat protein [Mailhella sp.]|uniref:tetratricopeptide repeat protein n=1 Tax=Mailhella sp. TaxID=1981029 RepID=UPI003AB2B0AB
MKSEKTRGVMLTSSAIILSVFTFVVGFACGKMFAETRSLRTESPAVAPVSAPAQPAVSADAQAEHIRHLREEALSRPDSAEAWTKLGNACFDAGDPDGAIEAYQASLNIEPGNADVRTDMGSMYRMRGEAAKAVECYDQALRDSPGHRNAIFNKGVTMMLDLEQPERAVAFWQSVLKDNPGLTLSSGAELRRIMPEIVVDAALQLEARGRKEAALRAYREALKLDDSSAPALVHGAWLLEGMGRSDEALPLWKRVLELHPDATDPAGKPVRDRVGK